MSLRFVTNIIIVFICPKLFLEKQRFLGRELGGGRLSEPGLPTVAGYFLDEKPGACKGWGYYKPVRVSGWLLCGQLNRTIFI